MSKLPENTEYTGAVGALVTCEINGKKYVILQKRVADDSFPGCLQVTVHGGLKGTNKRKRESMSNGLGREVREEVYEILERSTLRWPNRSMHWGIEEVLHWNLIGGGDLVESKRKRNLLEGKGILSRSRKTREGTTSKMRKTDITLGFDITFENQQRYPLLMPEIRKLQTDGVIVLLSSDEIDKLVPIDPKLHKEHGVTEDGKYGMFADEIEAVKKALTQ
ncbi:MAG: hypothetical protein WC753_02095 [Candidatus Gracilibacteria bacterium]